MVHWDNLLIQGKNIFGFAVDDSHWDFDSYRPDATGSAWIMLKAKRLSTEEIMHSIGKGLFYASCGPVIKSLSVEEDRIYVVTSPVKSIFFIAPNGGGKAFWAVRSFFIESGQYKLRNGESYVRVQCTDEKGKTAWTNAIFFRD